MTTLALGSNRGSTSVAAPFDDRDPDVKRRLRSTIQVRQAAAEYGSICGHRSGAYLDSADWLGDECVEPITPTPAPRSRRGSVPGTVRSGATATSQGRRGG